jgi:hypothetical protein
MNDHELAEIFSDVLDFVRLKKIPSCSKNNEKQLVEKFSTMLKISETKELNKILSLLPHFGFFKNIFSEYLWCTPMYAKKMGFDAPEDLMGKSDLYFPWS